MDPIEQIVKKLAAINEGTYSTPQGELIVRSNEVGPLIIVRPHGSAYETVYQFSATGSFSNFSCGNKVLDLGPIDKLCADIRSVRVCKHLRPGFKGTVVSSQALNKELTTFLCESCYRNPEGLIYSMATEIWEERIRPFVTIRGA